MLSIRAARRYRWRLAGGRLNLSAGTVRFVPNQLERWRSDTYWECLSSDVSDVRVRGKVWLVIETAVGTERFRVFQAAAMASTLKQGLQAASRGPGQSLAASTASR